MGSNNITSAYKGGMAFSTLINGHAVTIDLDKVGGGNDLGTSPKILMLVSLAGCTGVDVVSILNKMKVSFSDLTINVEAHITEEHPKIYDDVTIIYSIKVDTKNELNVKKAVDLSQDKYCGVSAMFRSFAKLSSKIVFLS
ncbi:MAG TPA: OsmC family protein [Chitinophagaceae bacterium]|nr:OsmC family protein [Chitinophagaceae bacterium]